MKEENNRKFAIPISIILEYMMAQYTLVYICYKIDFFMLIHQIQAYSVQYEHFDIVQNFIFFMSS